MAITSKREIEQEILMILREMSIEDLEALKERIEKGIEDQ